MGSKLIRCALHLETLKYGKASDPTRPQLEDQLKSDVVARDAKMRGINRVGIDLSFAESRALFAVQSLFDATDYRGNTKPAKAGAAYHFEGELLRLEVPMCKYLHAYGVKQKQSKRRKLEFNAKARQSALDALRSLGEKEFLMAYERKFGAHGNERVEVISPLIALEEETDGKFLITPNPIMVDQIEKYFLWKPADLFTGVLSGKDRTAALFTEYLLYLFEMHRRSKNRKGYVVRRQRDAMARALKMDSLLGARQNGRLRARLTGLYEGAVEVGYLTKYELDVPGKKVETVDCLHLNEETFTNMRSCPPGLPVKVAESTPNVSKVYP